MKLIIPISAFLFAVSCGKKEEEKTSLTTVLEGTWSSACKTSEPDQAGGSATSEKKSIAVVGNSATYYASIYADGSCSAGQEVLAMRATSTFTIGSATTTPADATQIDSSSFKIFLTLKNDDLVTGYNTAPGFYGKTDWAKNVEKEITGLSEDGSTSTDSSSDYGIFKITGNTVCFGKDSETNDGSTPEKRPTELDSSECFTKQ